MQISLVAFGIATDILSDKKINVELQNGKTLSDLRIQLEKAYPEFTKLKSLSFAVNEEYQEDTYLLSEGEVVVIIPPVSGG